MTPDSRFLTFHLADTKKPGFSCPDASGYLVTLKTPAETYTADPDRMFPIAKLKGAEYVIPKLYYKTTDIENLICVAPVLHLAGQSRLPGM